MNGRSTTTRERPPTSCACTGEPAGGAWDAGGRIVFGGPGNAGLQQVAAAGGEPVALTVVDVDGEENRARLAPRDRRAADPVHTPRGVGGTPRLSLLDRETGETRPLLLADGGGWFVEPSFVVFVRRGEIFAAPIALDAEETRGTPIPPAGAAGRRGQRRKPPRSGPVAACGRPRDGTLFFVPPPATGGDNPPGVGRSKRSFRAARRRCGTASERRGFLRTAGGWRSARSPLSCAATSGCSTSQAGGGRRQVTAEAGDNHSPVWSPDGATLTFASSRTGLQRLFRLGVRRPRRLRPPGRRRPAHAGIVVAGRAHARLPRAAPRPSPRHLDLARRRRAEEAMPWLATDANERAPAFSPDGRWIRVRVRRRRPRRRPGVHPPRGRARGRPRPYGSRRSEGTGNRVWDKSGGALFYRRGRSLYRVAIDDAGRPGGDPEHLFDGAHVRDPPGKPCRPTTPRPAASGS